MHTKGPIHVVLKTLTMFTCLSMISQPVPCPIACYVFINLLLYPVPTQGQFQLSLILFGTVLICMYILLGTKHCSNLIVIPPKKGSYGAILVSLPPSIHPSVCPSVPHAVSAMWFLAYFLDCFHMWHKYNPGSDNVSFAISRSVGQRSRAHRSLEFGGGGGGGIVEDRQSTIFNLM